MEDSMADLAYDYDDVKPLKSRPPLKEVKWTYKDYKGWELKPGERVELIYGIVYAMSAPNIPHQRIATILTGEFYNFLKNKTCEPFTAPVDVRLFYKEDESDDTVVQPDIIVVCDPQKLGKEGCRGAPDLVIEILSPSNTVTEMLRKKNLYQKAGVLEFWIIDPEEKQIEINILKDGHYSVHYINIGETLKSFKFPGFELPLDVLFAEE